MSEKNQNFIDYICEIIMEEKNFTKKYEMLIFIKMIEDHMISLYGSTENGETYESDNEVIDYELNDNDNYQSEPSSSENEEDTEEDDITDEEYEVEVEQNGDIEFFSLK